MTALTYDDTCVSTPKPKAATKIATKAAPKTASKSAATEAPRQGLFARALAAMMAARMRQAERDVWIHTRHLPRVRYEQGERPFGAAGDDMSRGGW